MGSTEKLTTGLEMAAEDTGEGRFGQGAILNMVTAPADRRTPDQPCADCLDHSLAAGRTRPAVPRRVAFWLVALILTVTMLGTTLPTPLYVIYQAQWHFSAAIVTVTFAVYAAGVLTSLLLAGRSSDQAGRKPVLAVALGASALSTIVFILAPDLGALIAARIVSGLSAGLMTGTATATLTELVPASASRRASLVATAANMGGLGLGPLIAGLFAQYAPDPTVLVFEVYLAVLAAAGLFLFFVPETVSPRHRPTLRLARLGIPELGRDEFVAAGVAAFSAFSVLGLFSALAPTFLGDVLHEGSHAVQGAVVFLLLAVGTLTQVLLSRFSSRRVMLAGLGLFLAALALIVAALSQATLALFLTGTVVGGVAVGAVFLGSLATANRLAPPGQRGQVVSAYFVMCYCGLIIPVVGVGVASEFIGDFRAVLAFSILLAALCLFSLAGIWRALLPPGRPQAPDANDTSRHSTQDSSHSEGGEAACPPGLKTRVSTPRSQ
jgi:MFS family permease